MLFKFVSRILYLLALGWESYRLKHVLGSEQIHIHFLCSLHFMILMSFFASLCSSFWCFHSGNYWYWPGFLAFLNQWKLTGGQTRNSGIRLYLGFCAGCRSEWKQITRSVAHLLPKWGTSLFLVWGEGRGVFSGGGWLRWFCPPFRWCWVQWGHAQYLLFLVTPRFCSWLFRNGIFFFLFAFFVSFGPKFASNVHAQDCF